MARPNSSPAMVMTATLSVMRMVLSLPGALRSQVVVTQRRVREIDERAVDEPGYVHGLGQEPALDVERLVGVQDPDVDLARRAVPPPGHLVPQGAVLDRRVLDQHLDDLVAVDVAVHRVVVLAGA